MNAVISWTELVIFTGAGAYMLEGLGLSPFISPSDIQETICPSNFYSEKSCSADLSHLKALSPEKITFLIFSREFINRIDRIILKQLSSLTGRNFDRLPGPTILSISLGIYCHAPEKTFYFASVIAQTVIIGHLGMALVEKYKHVCLLFKQNKAQ